MQARGFLLVALHAVSIKYCQHIVDGAMRKYRWDPGNHVRTGGPVGHGIQNSAIFNAAFEWPQTSATLSPCILSTTMPL